MIFSSCTRSLGHRGPHEACATSSQQALPPHAHAHRPSTREHYPRATRVQRQSADIAQSAHSSGSRPASGEGRAGDANLNFLLRSAPSFSLVRSASCAEGLALLIPPSRESSYTYGQRALSGSEAAGFGSPGTPRSVLDSRPGSASSANINPDLLAKARGLANMTRKLAGGVGNPGAVPGRRTTNS